MDVGHLHATRALVLLEIDTLVPEEEDLLPTFEIRQGGGMIIAPDGHHHREGFEAAMSIAIQEQGAQTDTMVVRDTVQGHRPMAEARSVIEVQVQSVMMALEA